MANRRVRSPFLSSVPVYDRYILYLGKAEPGGRHRWGTVVQLGLVVVHQKVLPKKCGIKLQQHVHYRSDF